jgi:hypothetical protein
MVKAPYLQASCYLKSQPSFVETAAPLQLEDSFFPLENPSLIEAPSLPLSPPHT